MTDYERWENKLLETMMPDDPFPKEMMPCIERFFRDVHPKLKPGQDSYAEVFETELFFPLQRKRELEAMMRIARLANACPGCDGQQYLGEQWAKQDMERRGGKRMPFSDGRPGFFFADAEGRCLPVKTIGGYCSVCKGEPTGPVTVMEIGADKGGGLYHWCMCLPTVKNVIACEIRGTPYKEEFEKAFPHINFFWMPWGSLDEKPDHLSAVQATTMVCKHSMGLIDVLFIDGDKLGFRKDFDAYLPLMRRPGGVIFLHDITDTYAGGPGKVMEQLRKEGWKVETIVNTSESPTREERDRLDKAGVPTKNPHDAWLRHWYGRSCGVGVVYL